MREILKQKLNKKGFTLAELLIVVAIIAILAAIAFPVFSVQLGKAKAGTDLANLKSAINIASIELMSNNGLSGDALTASVNTALDTPEPQSGTGALVIKTKASTVDGITTNIVDVAASTFAGKTVDELIVAAGSKKGSP